MLGECTLTLRSLLQYVVIGTSRFTEVMRQLYRRKGSLQALKVKRRRWKKKQKTMYALSGIGLALFFVYSLSIWNIFDTDLLFDTVNTLPISVNAPPSPDDITIIAIGCSRPDGLLRTLNSAKALHDLPSKTKLHICVDGCPGNDNVRMVAQSFEWPFGEMHVTLRESPFGLARHITSCWKDPEPNQWALFLEDDCILSPHAFTAFQEARQIRSQHPRRDQIIGIAMHDSRVNQYCWKDHVSQSYHPVQN